MSFGIQYSQSIILSLKREIKLGKIICSNMEVYFNYSFGWVQYRYKQIVGLLQLNIMYAQRTDRLSKIENQQEYWGNLISTHASHFVL